MKKIYDVVIVGGGPAGLSAALYAARLGLKVLVLTKQIGGQANYISILENYPGLEKISGYDFIEKLKKQIEKLAEINEEEVIGIKKEKDFFVLTTKEKEYFSKTIILALGRESKRLNAENEEKFIGKGVSYCSICDAPLFANKTTAVIGSGNSAIMTALLLSKFAKKVYIISKYDLEEMKAEKTKIEEVLKNKKIEFLKGEVKKIKGKNFVEEIELEKGKVIKVDGIFIEIGKIPNTALAKQLGIEVDREGYIITNEKKETNIKGIFAAGDCTKNFLKQIITACAEGAIAAKAAHDFLKNKKF